MGLVLVNLKELYELIIKELRLRSDPVGVKLFKELSSVPPNVSRVPDRATICQLSTLARLHSLTYYATADDIACKRGATSLGLIQLPEDVIVNEDAYAHTVDVDTARKLYTSIPMLPPDYKAVLMGPLNELSVDPDVVLIAGNPAQMLKVVEGWVWFSGEPATLAATGVHGICGYGIANTLKTSKLVLTLPCSGARRVGLYIDDEMVAIVPFNLIDKWVDGLICTHETGHPYPIPPRIVWNPPPPPHTLLKPKT